MNWYLKVEGSGGGTSGSGILFIEVYDQKGSLVKLTKGDVIETNASQRIADDNYIRMFQTKGSLQPYNGIASGIFYTIKLPEYVNVFAKVLLKNETNNSYDVRNIKISISKDNIEYQQIFYDTFATSEEKIILQAYSFYKHRILLQSNNKTHSIQTIYKPYELNMTSNTSPSPLVSNGYKAFDGNLSTYHIVSNDYNGLITLDIGKEILISKIEWIVNKKFSTTSFVIKASKDKKTWNTLYNETKECQWLSAITYEKTFIEDSYRYFQISFGYHTRTDFNFSEIRF